MGFLCLLDLVVLGRIEKAHFSEFYHLQKNECGLLGKLVHDFVVLNEATLVLVVKLDTLALFCRFPNLEGTAVFVSKFVWNVMRTRPSFPAEVSHAFL